MGVDSVIKFENIEKLYSMVVSSGITLSMDEVSSLGFTDKDIEDLEKSNILHATDEGLVFSSSSELSEYGLHLIRRKGHCAEARSSFKRSIEIDPSNSIARFRLFSEAVFDRDWANAFTYFERVYEEDSLSSPRVTKTNKLILYLFNYIYDIPKVYRKEAKSFQLSDLLLSDDEIKNDNMYLYNKIAEYTYKGNFYKALGCMQELKDRVRKLYGPELVLVRMLNAANAVKRENRNKIDSLILQSDYDEALKIIGGLANKRQLEFMEYYKLRLLTNLRDVRKKGKVFKVEHVDSFEPMHAIRHHDYERALELQKSYNKVKGYDDNKCAFCHLLGELIVSINDNKVNDVAKGAYQKRISSGE